MAHPTNSQTIQGLTMNPIVSLRAAIAGAALALSAAAAAQAGTYDITVDKIRIDAGDFRKSGVGYNNSQTPTILRFREGEEVTLNVTNNLREDTSIHWHGLILPFDQDGVPEISFDGIKPGETFTYKFPIVQAGTYWFHSHSGFQEPDGAYGAIVIEPKRGETVRADRDYVVQLTDTHPHRGKRIMRNLKMSADYYNRSQRSLQDLIEDSGSMGLKAALEDRKMWGRMRMMPTDIEDVQGFTPMINGQSTAQNWTGLFKPGEKVRLRLINSSAMAYFDVRIPGLKMTVVQADGNDVKPVTVDELRIAVAETYDVIVQPRESRAYSILAESMGRTAMVRGTLAPREGLAGPVPAMRPKPRLTMADMAGMMGGMGMEGHVMRSDTGSSDSVMMMSGMDHSQHQMQAASDSQSMAGMDHSQHNMAAPAKAEPMAGMDHSQHSMGGAKASKDSGMAGMNHGGHQMAMAGEQEGFYAAGSGLTPSAANGGKFLSYDDLSARRPLYRDRPATREIELRLTGNMERYIWSINGKKLSEAEPLRLKYGERVRFKFVNETMMAHPMHLHGMWTIVDTGKGRRDPIKHTISVAPGTTVYTETEVDVTGQWAFHCHLSYHADAGMFRKVIIEGGPA
uniref:copper resistance system multicopper oxidase n=2 Tax=Leisingera sp. ANG-M1 TaxID=1577895 RepID=UPI0023AA1D17|nr:copper resistance system multicopper oxidase [Leisingera sp. ANG-M1]